MAERIIACRDSARRTLWAVGHLLALISGIAWALPAHAQEAPPRASAGASVAATTVPAQLAVPRLTGRLHAADIGIVINTADPYSVAVGAHYIAARGLQPAQVLRVELPVRALLSREEFESFHRSVEAFFGPATQALALAWAAPYAVECN